MRFSSIIPIVPSSVDMIFGLELHRGFEKRDDGDVEWRTGQSGCGFSGVLVQLSLDSEFRAS